MKIFIILIFVSSLFASDYENGKNLFYQKGCSNCHGTNAEGSGNYPKLANKSQTSLLKKLKQFQNGISSSQEGQMMFSFAKSLNKNELQEITTFLSKFKKDLSTKYEISDDILGSVD